MNMQVPDPAESTSIWQRLSGMLSWHCASPGASSRLQAAAAGCSGAAAFAPVRWAFLFPVCIGDHITRWEVAGLAGNCLLMNSTRIGMFRHGCAFMNDILAHHFVGVKLASSGVTSNHPHCSCLQWHQPPSATVKSSSHLSVLQPHAAVGRRRRPCPHRFALQFQRRPAGSLGTNPRCRSAAALCCCCQTSGSAGAASPRLSLLR